MDKILNIGKKKIVDVVEKQNKKENQNPLGKAVTGAFLEHSKDFMTGNYFSSKFKQKLAEQFNNNDDLHTFIANTIVQELKSLTKKKSGPPSPPPLFVTKILQKIKDDEDFKDTVRTILDKADMYRSNLINKLDTELQKVINGIKTKYIGNYRQSIDFDNYQPIDYNKYALVTVNFGKKNNKIKNPSTGRYVNVNGKIGRELIRSNALKKTHKNKHNTMNKRNRYPKRRHNTRIK